MEDKESAAYKIGKPFRDDEGEESEGLMTKVKRWIESQFSGPSFGEKISEELKKKQQNQLTPPKK